jgi:hypothetical protein
MPNTLTKPPGNLSAESAHKVSDGEMFWRISTGAEGMHGFASARKERV